MKTIIAITLAGIIIGGAIFFANKGHGQVAAPNANNVSIVDGTQIVEIGAKGGYSPQASVAKADIPTILRMQTRGSFDCSSALTIPSLGYRANLPPSGTTDIPMPPQKSGTILQGHCAMGMYSFEVRFE